MLCKQCKTEFCWFCFRLDCGTVDCKENSRAAIDAMKEQEKLRKEKHEAFSETQYLYERKSKDAELIRKELEIGQNTSALDKSVYLAFRTIASAYLTIGKLKQQQIKSDDILEEVTKLEAKATRGLVKEEKETIESYLKRVAWKTQSTADEWIKLQEAQTYLEKYAVSLR